jgi:hypothetical protein
MVRFSDLVKDETTGQAVEINVREISQSAIMACPHVIMVALHYRPDGTCRCNDAKHREMKAWGYVWNRNMKAWVDGE